MSDIEAQLERLQREVEVLRIKRGLAEQEAREAALKAEQEAMIALHQEQKQAEQAAFAELQEENRRKIREWQLNPFLYAEEHGLWEE